MRRNPSEWRVARGVAIHSTPDGLLVHGPQRLLRVRLANHALERAVVEMLEGKRTQADVSATFGQHALQAALDLLRSHDAVVESSVLTTGFADLAAVGLPAAIEVHSVSSPERVGELARLVVIAFRSDARVGDFVRSAHVAGVPVLLAWLSKGDVVVCADEPDASPCVLCALRLDTHAPFDILPDHTVIHATVSGDVDARDIGRALVTRFLAPGARPPPPGRALVFDLRTCHTAWESFPRHPRCVCAKRSDDAVTFLDQAPDWDDFESRRFGAVIPIHRDPADPIARVLYRGRGSPWPVERASYGVALAAGPKASERAIAEAFERFAMLHAGADVVARAARDLDEPTLDPLAIASLLHGEAQHAREGFRFPRFSSDLVLDWSWAEHARGDGRLLVPTSLIGRASPGSIRLCDATSNGYACHASRDEARAKALLEVCERDASLLAWYAEIALPRIEGLALPRGCLAFLATQDVDLPVVVLATCRADGSLRTASAAALSFDAAVDGALFELEGQMGSGRELPPSGATDLERADVRHGPLDHIAHYGGARGREGFAHLARSAERVDVEKLRSRWQRRSDTSPADDVIDAFERAGLEALFVDRSLPELFGRWRIVRALVPRAVEMSFGNPYRRLASPRLLERVRGKDFTAWPHPYA